MSTPSLDVRAMKSRLAASRREAERARKAAKVAKLAHRAAKAKLKEAKQAAKKLRKEADRLETELAAVLKRRRRGGRTTVKVRSAPRVRSAETVTVPSQPVGSEVSPPPPTLAADGIVPPAQ